MICRLSKNPFSALFLSVLVACSALTAAADVLQAAEIPASMPAPTAQNAETSFSMEVMDPYSIRIFSNRCVADGQAAAEGVSADNIRSCTKTLITTGIIAVACGERSLNLKPSEQGIAALPLAQIGYLETLDRRVAIVWQYEGATITTHANFTPEQKQATIKKYLETLSANNLFNVQLSELSDFDKSASRLKENIRDSLPKYYRLKKNVTNGNQAAPAEQSDYRLVPVQQRMFYTYGDFTGNAELPVIEFNDAPRLVVIRTSIINRLLPAFQNEDRNVKLVFKDESVWVTNKTGRKVKLGRLSLSYNGTFIDNLLERPLELAPSATSNEISIAVLIEKTLHLREKQENLTAQEAQQMKINFGLGAAYLDPETNDVVLLDLVNSYSVSELVRNSVETARLDEHMTLLVNDKSAPPSELQFTLKVEFDTGKHTIRKEFLNNLHHVGMTMQKYSKIRVKVDGYTDNVGDEDVNQILSEHRALAVKQFLVQTSGIDPARIETAGFGMSRPVADNCTAAGRAQNRRIELRYSGVASERE